MSSPSSCRTTGRVNLGTDGADDLHTRTIQCETCARAGRVQRAARLPRPLRFWDIQLIVPRQTPGYTGAVLCRVALRGTGSVPVRLNAPAPATSLRIAEIHHGVDKIAKPDLRPQHRLSRIKRIGLELGRR